MDDAMETMDQTITRLGDLGYTAQFRAEGGALVETHSGRRFRPNELKVDEQVRFEGTSDPDDEALIFALSSGDGLKGTWVVHYGAEMPPEQQDVVRAIGS